MIEDIIEQRPGLYEAFLEWATPIYKELGHKRDIEMYANPWFTNFMMGQPDMGFITPTVGTFTDVPFPPYLIAIRDMSLL